MKKRKSKIALTPAENSIVIQSLIQWHCLPVQPFFVFPLLLTPIRNIENGQAI